MALKTKIELRPVFDKVILTDSNDAYAVAIAPTLAELFRPQRTNTREILIPANRD